ncbi:MAG: NAD-glutamate dehydrogenase [Sphingomonadaceae bacterium]|nr:NAD-glutamate dehydrogenase [Sphingomonadaceae bacterium]
MQAASTRQRAGADAAFVSRLADILVAGALPGELDGFSQDDRLEAARFVAAAAGERAPGTAMVALQSLRGEAGRRRMRLAVVNDDMPFLVDSVAGAIAARGLAVYRLLHPILAVRRDAGGVLTGLLDPTEAAGERRESLLYFEIERADARTRRALAAEIEAILADVRVAVADWPRMQAAMRDDADALPDGEGAALLRWLLDGNMTLLGCEIEGRDGVQRASLGILRNRGAALWCEDERREALARFAAGAEAPLVLKADRIATVHRRVPMDLVVLPHRTGDTLDRVTIYCGLWTSAALAARPDRVPVLRARLGALQEKWGFAPASHAAKALHHVLSDLPHDLLVAFPGTTLEAVALTAMGLIDRPRPKLLLAPGTLGRKLFAFVWLPRDELTTARRVQIGTMLEEASAGSVSSWSSEIGDGELAMLRYTLDVGADMPAIDAGALDRRLEQMVRGWAPALESALAELIGPARATRLTLTYGHAFPPQYRARYDTLAAAQDVLRLASLGEEQARAARLYQAEGDAADRLRLKIYRADAIVPLSDVVPVLENFGFRVIAEMPTALGEDLGYIHEFALETSDAQGLFARAAVIEATIAAVLEGRAENDAFNALLVSVGLEPRALVLFRAWFRYLRQTGMSCGLATVTEALRRAPDVARALIELFDARLDPVRAKRAEALGQSARDAIDAGLLKVTAIDDDRILRRLRAVIEAILRTNAFAPAGVAALAFKLDSAALPNLPAPRPWREIWVYSPRVEGIHLRGGPIARGGIRWSDRRDDFRTEILGLMKAQVVKNAVIVPTGAKGGFYPKTLPLPTAGRAAWLVEGTESYRIFIRALLSVTDNIVGDKIVHPDRTVVHDGDDPYFVVAADKGTASFSDIANEIATTRDFWLGDAFASGGSQGYDHKAMGITARGAWISVTRHFAELGVDLQKDPVSVVGCGDMSGDVFGNGMLLSKSLRLIAAFDHRHIFLDPDPDTAKSWVERKRLFDLPTSSWADYDPQLISTGGGIHPRTQKEILLSGEIRASLGIRAEALDPSALIAAILKAPVDLLWFGGIGTYVKGPAESHLDVGDPANDAHRINGDQVGARVIGEGANLGVTQAGRIAYSLKGGRSNTDFIDNSAGVDCSDNEVNIKIPLNREIVEGRLTFGERNALLGEMTDEVAALVLEDNRLQTLALSIAERGGAGALPSQLRVVEMLEASGRLDREVEGLGSNEALLRRVTDAQGLTRPELAVILAHGKLALQEAIENAALPDDPTLLPILHQAFPRTMLARHEAAIDTHRLRRQVIATEIANIVVNRLGPTTPFELAEEEGASLAQVAAAYIVVERLFELGELWRTIETAPLAEPDRLSLLDRTAGVIRLHMADLLRAPEGDAAPGEAVAALRDGVTALDAAAERLLRAEARAEAASLRGRLEQTSAPGSLVDRIVRLYELDGAIGTASLSRRLGVAEVETTAAYTRLGEALGLDWAKAAALGLASSDPWERLLAAGLARDFEQLRLDFLARVGGRDPGAAVDEWLEAQQARVAQFVALVTRARASAAPTAAMLAQITAQARILLAR